MQIIVWWKKFHYSVHIRVHPFGHFLTWDQNMKIFQRLWSSNVFARDSENEIKKLRKHFFHSRMRAKERRPSLRILVWWWHDELNCCLQLNSYSIFMWSVHVDRLLIDFILLNFIISLYSYFIGKLYTNIFRCNFQSQIKWKFNLMIFVRINYIAPPYQSEFYVEFKCVSQFLWCW